MLNRTSANWKRWGTLGLCVIVAAAPMFALAKAKAKPQPAAAAPAIAKPAPTPPQQLAPGQKAPDFTLQDTDGKSWHLADLTASGKNVVLEWFSPICPICEGYYAQPAAGQPSRMDATLASIAGPDVVWLAINSGFPGHGGGDLDLNAKTRVDWHVAPPVLLDPTGSVGHAFNAERTPTICIISAKGDLVYRGAPDDDELGPGMPSINFVQRAVAQLRSKQPVSIRETLTFG